MFDAVARIEVFLRSRLAYFAAKESGASVTLKVRSLILSEKFLA